MSQSYVNSQAGSQEQAQSSQQQAQSQQMATSSSGGGGGVGQQPAAGSAGQQQQQVNNGLGVAFGGEQMSQLMCATELTNLLLEFAFSVFVNKPQDIVEYAASYFNQLQAQGPSPSQQSQVSQVSQSQSQSQSREQTSGSSKRASSDSQRSNLSQNSFSNEHQNNTSNSNNQPATSDDDFDCEPPNRMVNFAAAGQAGQPKMGFNRRKSVFAEQYDPSADNEDDENSRVVHSKTDEQRCRLAKAIKAIFIFRSVDSQDMTLVLDAMFEVKVKAGDVVIRQGDDGDNFYVVERGRFQIYLDQEDGSRQVRGELQDNGSFGELALMYNQPRAATVVALTDGSLWAMDRNTFRRIVLKSAFKKRKEYEALFEKVSVLQCLNVSVFSDPILSRASAQIFAKPSHLQS